ncbi:uncharacterized protein K441DRAFT_6087 [Cenococcum geophilum 1.58]|uniref:uncharacterized protein n=1 Tax=Cenococcum geophilum 1.58 TaxID=794803 RepID=UPI00358F605D|nr:hypothetical protein K441DRAFT_6087 [Cenococcum geophilum 1.58]
MYTMVYTATSTDVATTSINQYTGTETEYVVGKRAASTGQNALLSSLGKLVSPIISTVCPSLPAPPFTLSQRLSSQMLSPRLNRSQPPLPLLLYPRR